VLLYDLIEEEGKYYACLKDRHFPNATGRYKYEVDVQPGMLDAWKYGGSLDRNLILGILESILGMELQLPVHSHAETYGLMVMDVTLPVFYKPNL